jgi:DNA-binding IclR family transcriptional regulator
VSGRARFEDNSVAAPPVDDVDEELRLLAAATGGTVVLFGWSGDAVTCTLRHEPPPQPLVVPLLDCGTLLPGTEAPLHVLLAWLAPDVLDRRLSRLDRAPLSVRNRPLLAMRLARVRGAGRDVVAGGVHGEVTSLAVPVRDADSEVTAALALVAPSVYLEDLDLTAIGADLERIAALLPADAKATAAPA